MSLITTTNPSTQDTSTCANPLFADWIREWETLALTKLNNENLVRAYRRAHQSMLTHPDRLKSAKEAVKLKHIGPKIVERLERQLEKHLKENGRTRLYSDMEEDEIASSPVASQPGSTDPAPPAKKPKTCNPRAYVPRYRTGAWGILMALSNQQIPIAKADIIHLAQPHCDSSYTQGDRATAWNSIKTLETKNLVIKRGRPNMYELSDEGFELVQKLESVVHDTQRNEPPLILRNVVVLDPDLPTALSSQSRAIYSATQQLQTLPPPAPHSSSRMRPSQNIIDLDSDLEDDILDKSNNNGTLDRPQCAPHMETSDPHAPFRFIYLSTTLKQTHIRGEALIDTIGSLTVYQVIFLKSQRGHPMTRNISLVSESLNDERLLVGWLLDKWATEFATGLGDDIRIDTSSSLGERSDKVKRALSLSSNTAFKVPMTKDSSSLSSSRLLNTLCKSSSTSPAVLTLQRRSFTVHLIIDNREVKGVTERREFLTEIENRGIRVETRPLEVGDMQWVAKARSERGDLEVVLDFVVERKRMDDLVSSIKDGRYAEQKSRLKRTGMRHIIYLVEEINMHQAQSFGMDRIQTALAATQIHDLVFVKKVANMLESVEYLCSMTKMIERFYSGKDLKVLLPEWFLDKQFDSLAEVRLEEPNALVTIPTFEVFTTKSKAHTIRDMFARQLLCIKGVSAEKVCAIIAVFPTWKSLLQAGPDAFREFDEGLGLRRKCGDRLRSRIWEFILKDDYLIASNQTQFVANAN